MSTGTVQQFRNVSYLWDEGKAAKLAGDEVALLIYRSNLLGADLRLTNYGGGNTSCKAMAKDPLTGNDTVSVSGARGCVPDPLHNLMTQPSVPTTFTAETATLPTVSVSAPDLIGAGSARLHGHIDPNGWATGCPPGTSGRSAPPRGNGASQWPISRAGCSGA